MTHQSEDSRSLHIKWFSSDKLENLLAMTNGLPDVCLIHLPLSQSINSKIQASSLHVMMKTVAENLAPTATLIILGEVLDLIEVHQALAAELRYQLWITIKRDGSVQNTSFNHLPHQHVGALVYTKYDKPLQHTKTRLPYTYCPACHKTTKDYGGKKHTYHAYGTLLSDVWRDIAIPLDGDISGIVERFADLFGLVHYQNLQVYDVSRVLSGEAIPAPIPQHDWGQNAAHRPESRLIQGDCLTQLKTLPDNSIDFAFIDPPYNLKKDYQGYADNRKITDYFTWCDAWISEVARVLRPGGTLALLNIPLWSIRHFLHLQTILTYQNWIVWDALSFPVRLIMPAHYTILCFSKGTPRPLPGLIKSDTTKALISPFDTATPIKDALLPLADGFCLRQNCIAYRSRQKINDRGALTDIWSDIHRLKHNTRRVDHPCQLPPQLLYRLIQLFTYTDEVVLDCFNGAGTTTLAAHQLGRGYIGIELEPQYHQLALERHQEIEQGIDPFRKAQRELSAKNSPVQRIKKQHYDIPKKTLQLEVKRVAQSLGHLPSRTEMIEHGQYPIRYYDDYFSSWGEVCAAARTTGMTESREDTPQPAHKSSQPRLF